MNYIQCLMLDNSGGKASYTVTWLEEIYAKKGMRMTLEHLDGYYQVIEVYSSIKLSEDEFKEKQKLDRKAAEYLKKN